MDEIRERVETENLAYLISCLPDDDRVRFRNELREKLYYETWIESHGLDRANPDISLAKHILYREMFESRTVQ